MDDMEMIETNSIIAITGLTNYPGPTAQPDLAVDHAAVFESGGKWYVRGTRDGAEVIVMGGWATLAEHTAAKLYDASGAEVAHELPGQELTDIDVLMLAVAEIAGIVEGMKAEMEAPK